MGLRVGRGTGWARPSLGRGVAGAGWVIERSGDRGFLDEAEEFSC